MIQEEFGDGIMSAIDLTWQSTPAGSEGDVRSRCRQVSVLQGVLAPIAHGLFRR